MAKEKLEVIKEADLTNNCPECFNQELKLTFYQKHKYNKLYYKVTNEVTNRILCVTCGSTIYPVKWTDDIERIFDYYQKMVQPKKSSLKFTALLYFLIFLLIALIGGGIYLFREGIIQF